MNNDSWWYHILIMLNIWMKIPIIPDILNFSQNVYVINPKNIVITISNKGLCYKYLNFFNNKAWIVPKIKPAKILYKVSKKKLNINSKIII